MRDFATVGNGRLGRLVRRPIMSLSVQANPAEVAFVNEGTNPLQKGEKRAGIAAMIVAKSLRAR